MAVSAIPSAPVSTPVPSAAQSAAAALKARAPDGDYKAANAASSHVKDRDGDYKPLGAATAASAAKSTAAVQAVLSSLKIGG